MSTELVERTAEYVKRQLHHEPSGHDWFHVERVWKMARRLQAAEGGDLELIELAALLHNLGDYNYRFSQFSDRKGSLALYGMMEILEIEDGLKERVIDLIVEIRYGGVETSRPVSIEGKIVQDANFLDTLGAIGVARCFASGGYHRRPLFDPAIKPRKRLTKHAYLNKKQDSTSINSFYEKAFRTARAMNTPLAQRIAAARVEYVKAFVEQFMKEWQGDDVNGVLAEPAAQL